MYRVHKGVTEKGLRPEILHNLCASKGPLKCFMSRSWWFELVCGLQSPNLQQYWDVGSFFQKLSCVWTLWSQLSPPPHPPQFSVCNLFVSMMMTMMKLETLCPSWELSDYLWIITDSGILNNCGQKTCTCMPSNTKYPRLSSCCLWFQTFFCSSWGLNIFGSQISQMSSLHWRLKVSFLWCELSPGLVCSRDSKLQQLPSRCMFW